jgi:hypothetical protein
LQGDRPSSRTTPEEAVTLSGHQTRVFVVLCAAVAIVAGCGKSRPASRSGPARQLKKSEMTAAEVKYGVAPVPDPSVTYQPNVVIVGGGAEAIRALSSTGLTWTIDASAPHASELEPGKILFMTNRAAGRVLDVRKDGNNLSVTLGPVLITEIIRDCDIHPDPIPIDLAEAIPYEVADLPGRVITAKGSAEAWPSDGDAALTPVAYTIQGTPAGPVPPATVVSQLVDFKLVPSVGGDGIGVKGKSTGGGLTLTIGALVHISHPTLTPRLIIKDGDLIGGAVELSGAAGLTMMFEAGTDVGLKANVNGRVQAVPDFSIPIGGPAPLALTIRQVIDVKTALGVRNATISGTGDYTFHGSFLVGHDNTGWTVGAPIGFTTKQSVLKSANGIAFSASGLDLTHQMRVVFGVGAWGLAAGPYFALTSAVGLFRGSDAGTIQCKEATIVLTISGGIGYLIPRPITDAINFILGTLHIRYRVDSFGGVESKPQTMINTTTTLPGCLVRQE